VELAARTEIAYRAYHATETAVLRLISDIVEALDSDDFADMTLLDLCAAFDTVDHIYSPVD